MTTTHQQKKDVIVTSIETIADFFIYIGLAKANSIRLPKVDAENLHLLRDARVFAIQKINYVSEAKEVYTLVIDLGKLGKPLKEATLNDILRSKPEIKRLVVEQKPLPPITYNPEGKESILKRLTSKLERYCKRAS